MSGEQESSDKSVHQRTLDRVSDAIVSVDTELRYTYLNQSAQELLGKPQSELLGSVIWDAFPEAQDTIAQEQIEKALRTRQETKYERYNDSLDCWFEVRVFPDTDGLSIFFKDITERKESDIELERYKQIIETVPVAVGQREPGGEGDFEYVNQEMVKMLDLESKGEVKKFPPADFYADPGDQEKFNDKIRANGEVHDFELKLEKPNGGEFWGSVTASLDTIGGDEYFIGVIQDITERKHFKQKLRDLHNATREMVSASTPKDVAEIITHTADQSIGYEMNGVHFYDESVDGLAPTSVSETSQEIIGDVPVLDEGIAWTAFQTGEIQVCNNIKEADNVYNEESALRSELAIPIGDHGVLLASDTEVGVFRGDDLTLIKILAKNAETALNQLQTEQKLRTREQELARQQEFLEHTQDVASIGGWEADIQTQTVEWTEEVHRIHGLPPTETPDLEESFKFYHPDDRGTIREAFEELTSDGEPYDLEVRIVTADDDVRWVHTRGEPLYEGGEIVAAHGTFQDITERKEREQELQRQNSRLNEFASVVSHDLRNPLNVAQARTTLLQQEADEELQEHLDPLVTALERMENIVEDTLTLARQGKTVGEMNSLPVVDLIGKCWAGVETAEATLEIEDEFTIRGDRDRLRHLFENLLRNAVEHGGDDVTVRVGRTDTNSIYIEDDGPGIISDRNDIFKPGHTSATGGTGFGLTIVKRIAEAHGWEVTVTDGRDGGARFEFDTAGHINE